MSDPKTELASRADFLDSIQAQDMEPTTFGGLYRLASVLSSSKLIPDHFKQDPASTMLVMLSARDLGLPLIPALQNAYVIGGKLGWQAVVLETLAKRSTDCKAFYLKSATNESASYVVQTADMPAPAEVTYTLQEAKTAGLLREGSGWTKNPKDMLVARCRTRAARQYFPEAILGMYSIEEIRDGAIPEVVIESVPVGGPPTGAALLTKLVTPPPPAPEPEDVEPILDVEPEPEPEEGELFPEPDHEPVLINIDPEIGKKMAALARETAAKVLGKFGPKLIENHAMKTWSKALEDLNEDQFELLDAYMADQKRKAKS